MDSIIDNSISKLGDTIKNTTLAKNNSTRLTTDLFSNIGADQPKQRFESYTQYKPDEVYATLSSGEKVAKFENYIPGSNNNERLAQNQTSTEQIFNGLTKAGNNMLTTILGNTAGFVYGIANGVKEGNMNAVFDNSFSKTLDDWNTKLNYQLPNYVTEDNKNKGFFGSLTDDTANFIFNDVAQGFSFTLGTAVSEAIWAYATGGASLATSAARVGARAASLGRLVRGTEKLGALGRWSKAALGAEQVGLGVSKYKSFLNTAIVNEFKAGKLSKDAAIALGKAGDVLTTARFIGTTSSNEAGIEAFHFKKEARENFENNFERQYGREATAEERAEFESDLASAANGVYYTNMAILSVSNLAMFGGLFNIKTPFKSLERQMNKSLFGIGTREVEKGVFKGIEATKGQKIFTGAYQILKPTFTEGVFEEGLQGVTTKVANKWTDSTYNPKYHDQTLSLASAAYESMAEQYGTKEGWKEIGIGGIIGLFGVFGKGGTIAKTKEARKYQEDYVAKALTAFGEKSLFAQDAFVNSILRDAKIQGSIAREQDAIKRGDAVGAHLAQNDKIIAELQFREHMGDNMDDLLPRAEIAMNSVTEEMWNEAGIKEEDREAHIQATLEGYKQTVNSYKEASNFANALVGNGAIRGTTYQTQVIKDALTHAIVSGEVSHIAMNESLRDITKYIGEENAKAVEIVGSLWQLSKAKQNQVKILTKEHEDITEKEAEVEKKLAELQAKPKSPTEADTTTGTQLQKLAALRVSLQERKTQIEQEQDTIASEISQLNQRRAIADEKSDTDLSKSTISGQDLRDIDKKMSNIDSIIESYQGTNKIDHNNLMTAMKQYKSARDTFYTYQGTVDAISNGKFKIKNKSGFLFKLFDSNYKMDDFTTDFLADISERHLNGYMELGAEEELKNIKAELVTLEAVTDKTEEQQKRIEEINKRIAVLEKEPSLQERKEALERELESIQDDNSSRIAEIDAELNEIEKQLTPNDTPNISQEALVKSQIEALEKERAERLVEVDKQENVIEKTITPDIEAKKADIERRQGLNGVEEIIFSNPNFRLEGFEIDGNYWNVVTSTDRAKVLVNINGVIVPFYLTTGQAGKGLVPGWYPFFGIGKDGWLNKTDKSDMETYYERYWGKETADIVKSISEELNSFYGTDPSTFKNDGDPNATSRPLTTLADKVEDYINSKLNYTPAINNADARKTLRSNVEQLGREINAKYDAELKALEEQSTSAQPEEKSTKAQQKEAINKEYDKKINKLKESLVNKPQKTELETLKDRIAEIVKNLRTGYISKDIDEMVKNRPDQKDMDRYDELIRSLPIKTYFQVQKSGTNNAKEDFYNKNKAVLDEYQALYNKLSNWRIYDSLVDEQQSIVDLLDLIEQMEQEVGEKETLEVGQEAFSFLGEDSTPVGFVANLGNNTNFTPTARLINKNVVLTHLKIATIISRIPNAQVTVKQPNKKKLENPSKEVLDKLRDAEIFIKEGLNEYYFKLTPDGRLAVDAEVFKSLSQLLNMYTSVEVTKKYVNWSWHPLMEQRDGEFVPMKSDFYNEKLGGSDSFELEEGDTMELYVDVNDIHSKDIAKGKNLDELTSQVRIYLRKDGKNYNDLKALNTGDVDPNFLALREAAATQFLTGKSGVIGTTKITYVPLGLPIMTLGSDNTIQPIEITQDGLREVVTTGYILNGELVLANKGLTDKVRKSFVAKLSKNNAEKKIPIIVFKRGVHHIAFPITMNKTANSKKAEFTAIIEGDGTEAQKIKAINNLLLENGLMPKTYGLTSWDEVKLKLIETALDNLEDSVPAETLADLKYDKNSLIVDAKIALDLTDLPRVIQSQKLNYDLNNIDYTAKKAEPVNKGDVYDAEPITKKVEAAKNIIITTEEAREALETGEVSEEALEDVANQIDAGVPLSKNAEIINKVAPEKVAQKRKGRTPVEKFEPKDHTTKIYKGVQYFYVNRAWRTPGKDGEVDVDAKLSKILTKDSKDKLAQGIEEDTSERPNYKAASKKATADKPAKTTVPSPSNVKETIEDRNVGTFYKDIKEKGITGEIAADSSFKGVKLRIELFSDYRLHKGEYGFYQDFEKSKNTVVLDAIESSNKSKGEATQALKILTSAADKNNVKIQIIPSAFGKGGLTTERLKEWYEANGFISIGGELMEYQPKESKRQTAKEENYEMPKSVEIEVKPTDEKANKTEENRVRKVVQDLAQRLFDLNFSGNINELTEEEQVAYMQYNGDVKPILEKLRAAKRAEEADKDSVEVFLKRKSKRVIVDATEAIELYTNFFKDSPKDAVKNLMAVVKGSVQAEQKAADSNYLRMVDHPIVSPTKEDIDNNIPPIGAIYYYPRKTSFSVNTIDVYRFDGKRWVTLGLKGAYGVEDKTKEYFEQIEKIRKEKEMASIEEGGC